MSNLPYCPKCGYVGNVGDNFCPKDAAALLTADALVGTSLDHRYEILAKLGEGGMGAVYKARNKHVPERLCAVKIIKQELAKGEDSKKRFLREAQALIRARHRHIVEAYDVYETTDGVLFLVMEFLSGQTLEELIRRQPGQCLPLSQALYILDQVAEALHHAHNLKIVHRDIKPGNIFVVNEAGDRNFVKMVDFGLARLLDQVSLTHAAQVMGTPGYMAPEIFFGGDYISPALDVYALGCTLFELLTGRLPFEFADFDVLQDAHINLSPPRLAEKRPDTVYAPEVESLVKGMLAKKRDNRPKLPELRKMIQELRTRLPARTAQSLMLSATDPDTRVPLHARATLIKPDAKVRKLEGQLAAIEQVEIERTKVGGELDEVAEKILTRLSSQLTPELRNLRAEWVENRLRELKIQERLEIIRKQQEQDEQAVMRRKSDLHLLIDRVRSDIRKRPPQNTDESAQDEMALAELERAYFAVQIPQQVAETVARLLKKQQKVRHKYFIGLHKLAAAVTEHVRSHLRQRDKLVPQSELQTLERLLEHLHRCNQNVEALGADLPFELR
jgi:serine/threonine-protein kinase